jgi:hypothetical protein
MYKRATVSSRKNCSSCLFFETRHEKFCELVASGVRPSAAYVSLGYSGRGADQGASRLLRKPEIHARIIEIQTLAQKSAVEKCALTRAWVIEQLMDNVRIAKQRAKDGDWDGSVANRALEGARHVRRSQHFAGLGRGLVEVDVRST